MRGKLRLHTGRILRVAGAMLAISTGAVLFGVGGCAANDEDDAVCREGLDKFQTECGGTATITGNDVDCEDEVRCLFQCINEAPCEEINNPAGTTYQTCKDSCGGS